MKCDNDFEKNLREGLKIIYNYNVDLLRVF